MDIIVYILAILVGLSLGLIGGGGSILTVPILVYIADIDPIAATSYSLFIVGISAFFGATSKIKKNEVDLKKGIYFGIPSILSIFLTRKFILDLIPDILIEFNNFTLTKPLFILIFFAFLMLFAGFNMLKNKKDIVADSSSNNIFVLVILGFVVGFIVGLVGAGGGFLIIPALVSMLKMKMKDAIGTSLMIIALNSFFGILGDLLNGVILDYTFLVSFSIISVIGIYLGNYLSNFISGQKLKKYFAYFVIIVAIYMILKETLFL